MSFYSFKRVARFMFILLVGNLYFACSSANISSNRQTWSGVNEDTDASKEFIAVDYGPLGVVDGRVARHNIYVVFSKPVVALAKLGELLTTSDVFAIEPPLKGIYRWYGTRYLSFVPEEALRPQTSYTVTINSKLRSLGDKKIKGTKIFSFSSEPLNLWNFFPGTPEKPLTATDVPLEAARHLTLLFNAEVQPDIMSRFITVAVVRAQQKEELVEFQARRPDLGQLKNARQQPWFLPDYSRAELQKHMLTLTIKPQLQQQSKIIVRLAQGAHGGARGGTYGTSGENGASLPQEISRSYSTLQRFIYKEACVSCGSGDLTLTFSHPLNTDSQKQIRPADIQIGGQELKQKNLKVWGRQITLENLAVATGEKWDFRVDTRNIYDIYGRQLSTETLRDSLVLPPVETRVTFHKSDRDFIVEAAFPPKVLLEYQNLQGRDARLAFGHYTDFKNWGDLSPRYKEKDFYTWQKYFNPLPKFAAPNWQENIGRRNYAHYYLLDFSPYLNKDGFGRMYYLWADQNPRWQKFAPERPYDSFRQYAATFQVSNLAVTARVAYNKVVAMISHLDNGQPAPGVDVRFSVGESPRIKGHSDAEGLITLALPHEWRGWRNDAGEFALRFELAENSDRLEYNFTSDHYANRVGNYGNSLYHEASYHDFVFTDRGVYRPGETLHFVGVARRLAAGKYSVNTGKQNIKVLDAQRNTKPFITQKLPPARGNGIFSSSLQIPQDLKPGHYNIETNNGSATFQVANFRRLNFSVAIENPTERPLILGEPIVAAAQAKYLAGGDMGGAKYQLSWERQPANFAPDNYRSYKFGRATNAALEYLDSEAGLLGSQGRLPIYRQTAASSEGQLYNYTAQFSVVSEASQELAARQTFAMHPAKFYIGIKSEKYFLAKNKKNRFDLVLVDLEAKLYTSPVEVQIEFGRQEWQQVSERDTYGDVVIRYETKEIAEQSRRQTIEGGRGHIVFEPQKSGSYFMRLRAKDKLGRTVTSELPMYASGSDVMCWDCGNDFSSVRSLGLQPDREQYRPGDTANLLLQSPLPAGKYLLTLEREGIMQHRVLDLEGSANEVQIPITEDFIPIVYASISSYGPRTQDPPAKLGPPDLGKPKGYYGVVQLSVRADKYHINVEMLPAKPTYQPGAKVSMTLRAKQNGRPARNVSLVFMAVDRGVVDLLAQRVPNPHAYFYAADKFPLRVQGAESRAVLMDPARYKNLPAGGVPKTWGYPVPMMSTPAGKTLEYSRARQVNGAARLDGQFTGTGDTRYTRRNFAPTAVFRSDLRTDKNGEASFEFTLPDTLTTYRTTVIAIARRSFGRQESEIHVQNPLNMKAALPRALREGDRANLGVLVSNVAAETQKLEITASSNAKLQLTETRRALTLKSGETRFVSFPAVALAAGEVMLDFELNSARLKEHLEQNLTVTKPHVSESFATVGKLDSKQPVRQEQLVIPGSALDGAGELSVKLSTNNFSLLRGALRYLREAEYLRHHGYNGTELATSILIPYLTLGSLVPQIDTQGAALSRREIQERLDKILRQQRADGSFAFWLEQGARPSLFASSRVGFFVYIAQMYGYELPREFSKEKLISFLTAARERERLGIEAMAFAYYVAAILDAPAAAAKYTAQMQNLLAPDKKPSLYVTILTALTALRYGDNELVAQLQEKIKQYVKPGTRSIALVGTKPKIAPRIDNWDSRYASETETLSLYLLLLLQSNDSSGLSKKVVNTLARPFYRDHWGGTIQNAMVVTAISSWNPPSRKGHKLGARVQLNGKDLLESDFLNQSSVQQRFAFTEEPLKTLERDVLQNLRLALKPANSLASIYYSLELQYSIPLAEQLPRDQGLGVFYEIVDLEGKIMTRKLAKLDLGQTYRLNVYVSTARDRSNVIVKIPLPSGAEVLDGSFVTSAQKPPADFSPEPPPELLSQSRGGEHWWNYNSSRQFIYDNMVLMAYERFKQGYRRASFLFRTTTAGRFPTPPVQAEALYEAEVFGRSMGKVFIIK